MAELAEAATLIGPPGVTIGMRSMTMMRRLSWRTEGMLADCGLSVPEESVHERQVRLASLTGLPRWAYAKRLKQIALKYAQRGKEVPLGVGAGEAIPLQFTTLIMRCGFLFCFAIVIFETSVCDDDHFAVYPWWTWMAFVPMAIASIALEWISHRYILISRYQVLGELQVLRCTATYQVWFGCHMILSLFISTGLATDSAFLGTFLKARKCQGHLDMEQQWVHFSSLGRYTSLTALVLASWVANIFELFWVLGQTVPTCADLPQVDYEVASASDDEHLAPIYNTRYDTCCEKDQNHGAALMALALANGSEILLAGDLPYAAKKAFRGFSTSDAAAFPIYLEHIRHQMVSGLHVIIVQGVLTNGFQLVVQVCVFALRCFMCEYDVTWEFVAQSSLAIVVEIIASFIQIYKANQRRRLAVIWAQESEQIIRGVRSSAKSKTEKLFARLKTYETLLTMFMVAQFLLTVGCAVAIIATWIPVIKHLRAAGEANRT